MSESAVPTDVPQAGAPPIGAAAEAAPDAPPKEKIPALEERPAHMPTEEDVRNALREIYDPELFISITELGLVYGVDYLPDDKVRVRMTLTSPACPLGEVLQTQVHQRLTTSFPAVKGSEIEWVWWPRWDPREMATEEAKMLLGIY